MADQYFKARKVGECCELNLVAKNLKGVGLRDTLYIRLRCLFPVNSLLFFWLTLVNGAETRTGSGFQR